MRSCRLLVALICQWLAFALAVPALAAPNHIAAELVVSSEWTGPGANTQLAIRFRPEPGWHGYWRNPGDAGFGMKLIWNLPKGSKIGPPRYPVPSTLLIAGLMNHVYEREYAVIQSFTVPADAPRDAQLPVSLKAEWLACTDKICVPESAELRTVVKVHPFMPGDQPPRMASGYNEAWERALPAPLGSPARFAITAGTIRIAIPLPEAVALSDPHLFIGEDKVVDYAAVQTFSRDGDLLVVEIPRAKFAATTPATLSGLLRLERDKDDGLTISAAPGTVPPSGMPLKAGEHSSLPWLLLAALAGGILLNVMPCVFPILSLKALSLARAGESEAEARAEGLAYTAGVVIACLALGGLLLALRAAGQEVGWAFQLQEPMVVVALLLLAAAITANLLGLYEFAVPGFASSGSAKGAFATGLLAAFVATPCTGPFMAAAMGAALLLPVWQGLALFAALGLGIALPFLAIAYVPALRRLLPRPGAWMAGFRRWMALPMGLTALALLWLCWRLGGSSFAIGAAILTVLLAWALWLAGRSQHKGRRVGYYTLALIAGIVFVALKTLPNVAQDRQPGQIDSILPSRPFSAPALAAARASGKPLFVYFTADWCLTCKVNEKAAIEREEVRAAFERAGVTVLVGDWTRRDPAITRFLTQHGAAGVPLYLWYPAGGGPAQQLPQVLTPGLLVSLAD